MYEQAIKLAKSVGRFVETVDGETLFIPHRKSSYLTGKVPATATIQPRNLSGDVAYSVNSPKSALQQLQALVARQAKLTPNRTKEQLFADVYAANPELAQREREEARAALVAKAEAPRMASNEKPEDEDKEREDDDSALEALDRKADELRRKDPNLTKAQAFAKAYSENPLLAAAERRRNRPVPTLHSKYEQRGD
jgi:hypothetical protein